MFSNKNFKYSISVRTARKPVSLFIVGNNVDSDWMRKQAGGRNSNAGYSQLNFISMYSYFIQAFLRYYSI